MIGQDYEQLTLFQGASPASHSPLPGSSEAKKMTVTSGQKCLESYGSCGPIGLLEKMLLGSSKWHSTQRYLTWKKKDTPQGHLYFQLAVSVPHIKDTGSQSWPTPNAGMRGDCSSERARKSPDLEASVKMREMFATPQARDYRTGQSGRWIDKEHRSRNLNDQIAMFPTPTTGAGLCAGTGNFQQLKKLEQNGIITEQEQKSMSQGNGGKLNPMWVEWLMGFPLGWTDLKA